MTVRAWVYGAKAPTENAELVRQQLILAHRYQNRLVEIENARRAPRHEAVLAALRAAPPDAPFLLPKPAPGPRSGDLPSTVPFTAATLLAHVIESTATAVKLLPVIWYEALRRLTLEQRAAFDADCAVADLAAAAAVRTARGESGLCWGTYQAVEEAVRRSGEATAPGAKLRFARWDDSGSISVHVQGEPLSTAALLAGAHTFARIVGAGKRRTLWLRVGSAGRMPVWAVFPFVYHRELPPDGKVKWVRACCRRVATHVEWTVQIVMESETFVLPPATRGSIAFDVGWRRMRDPAGGVRVAVWVDDEGGTGELRIPERLVERQAKVHDLGSIRDKNFNVALAALLEARRAGQLPAWVHEATQHAHAWKSPGKLAALVIRWRSLLGGVVPETTCGTRTTAQGSESATTPAPGLRTGDISQYGDVTKAGTMPAPGLGSGDHSATGDLSGHGVYAVLEAWRKQDKHLYEWEAHQQQNVLLARREQYRLFARYSRVIVEELDLRNFAEVPEGAEDPRLTASRPRRFVVALHELFGCCADAVKRAGGTWIEADPAHTTKTCADCRHVGKFDAAGSIEHMCEGCGRTFDQDRNAARNLLRAGQSSPEGGGRSKQADGALQTPSKAAERRAKGLAKGLATRRSKGRSEGARGA